MDLIGITPVIYKALKARKETLDKRELLETRVRKAK